MSWIYRTIDGNIGPIDTSQFLLAVQNRIVVPETIVRRSDQPEWMPASEIEGLVFPADSVPRLDQPEVVQTSHAASNVDMKRLFVECLEQKQSKSPPLSPVPVQPARVSRLDAIASGLGSVFSYLSDTAGSIGVAVLRLVVRVFKLRIVWISGLVVLLMLPIYLALRMPVVPQWTQREMYTSLKESFAEFQELRSKEAKADDWDEFQERTEATLADLMPRLKRNARIEDRASMSLLWIARDFFPKLLRSQSRSSDELEQKIVSHLDVAELVFRKTARQPPPPTDVMTPAAIGVAVVICLTILAYFGRSWYVHRFAAR